MTQILNWKASNSHFSGQAALLFSNLSKLWWLNHNWATPHWFCLDQQKELLRQFVRIRINLDGRKKDYCITDQTHTTCKSKRWGQLVPWKPALIPRERPHLASPSDAASERKREGLNICTGMDKLLLMRLMQPSWLKRVCDDYTGRLSQGLAEYHC